MTVMDDVDPTERLPEDVLADVLRRLPPRYLAASRCVCRPWRATVDTHGLLRAVLPSLPRAVGGIFMNSSASWPTSLYLSRPSTGPAFSADLHYTFPSSSSSSGDLDWEDAFEVRDHCNGLVLLRDDRVVNPATRQWTRVPPPRAPLPRVRWRTTAGLELDHDGGGGGDRYRRVFFYDEVYLVFDPTVSPHHFEVYCIPRVRSRQREEEREEWPAEEELEWPPLPCVLHVFSSETGQWEERSFAREGPALGTSVADMRADTFYGHRYAVYWRGALYVHCQTDFIMRLTLSSRKYRLIQAPEAYQPPEKFLFCNNTHARKLSIGKSKNGVYSVLMDWCEMKVWILDDDSNNNGQETKWVPKQLGRPVTQHRDTKIYKGQSQGRWRIQSITSHEDPEIADMVQENFDWDSDDDDVLPDGGKRTGYEFHITFLGFHPYKEVIFLNDSFVRVLAYHLNSCKIQDLGYVFPEEDLGEFFNQDPHVDASFPYTPCWMKHGTWESDRRLL